MDKKVMIAIILSMGVLLLYPYLLKKIYPPQPQAQKAAAPAEQAQKAPEAAPQAQKPEAPAVSVKEEFVTVETPLYRAVFSNIGGGVKNFELKKYSETLQNGKGVNVTDKVAKLNSFKTQVSAAGSVEDLVLTPSRQSLSLGEGQTSDLVFTGVTKAGLTVEKKYTFSSDTYMIETSLKFKNPTPNAYSATAENVISAFVSGKDATGYHQGPLVYAKDKLMRQAADEARLSGTEKLKWMGIEDKYFLAAMTVKPEVPATWVTESAANSSKAVLQIPLSLAPGTGKDFTYNTFIGPKEYDNLLKYKIGLEEAIEFGWFDFIAKPFLVVLNFFERYLKNYGLAIIVLTIIIKVLFYPLTKHSLKSMKEMQKIQPQMAAIKERYKDNKEKLNKEMMELYKRHKVNPVGGCLPMMLQIPVFIALYEVLYVAIELRHAPFYLWIHDLSDKDPYYITPIIMGVTMLIQQKMTPTSVDPTQAKIMLIMPIVFTFMFLSFPSGLVIYWLVNNVLSIAQQYWIQRPAPAKA